MPKKDHRSRTVKAVAPADEPDHLPHPVFADLHGDLTETMAHGAYWMGTAYIADTSEALGGLPRIRQLSLENAARGLGWPESTEGAVLRMLVRAYLIHRLYGTYARKNENPPMLVPSQPAPSGRLPLDQSP